MTTKQLIKIYPSWICQGDKRYVAVVATTNKENALRIANSVFKVKFDKLAITTGLMGGGYIYKSVNDIPNGKFKPVWIVEVV